MSAPRTIVLVHGAWHGAWCWAPVQAELSARGLASVAIDLPGHECTQDRAITIELQRMMSVRCKDIVSLDASHSPFLSMPAKVADILEPLARS